MNEVSSLGRIYDLVYGYIAGKHPNQRIWHFQWASVEGLHSRLKKRAPSVTGSLLDVGCGHKPYESWFRSVSQYVGIDVDSSGKADVVIGQESLYPFDNDEFDSVIAIEVLEHVKSLEHSLREIVRVMKPGGKLILSVPFLYNEHGAPGDFRRLTKHSVLASLTSLGYSIVDSRIETIGGFGSTLSILLLNWIEVSLNHNRLSRLVKGLLLPGWIVLALLVNVFGKLLDKIDFTDSFYHHVIVECTVESANSSLVAEHRS